MFAIGSTAGPSNEPLDPTAEAAAGQRRRWTDDKRRALTVTVQAPYPATEPIQSLHS
jgi:hypothetical protein